MKSPVFVVVGMHKSGTTLVARTLHLSGIRMVPTHQNVQSSYDEGGRYEWSAFNAINRDLLGECASGSLRINLQRSPTILDNSKARCKSLVAHANTKYRSWGFKDPRTTLTYPIWRRFLPDHRIVAIYRSPDEVAIHYSRRRSLFLGQVVRHWSAYNSKIIEHLGMSDTSGILLNFGALMSETEEWKRFQDFVGCRLVDARDASLWRSKCAMSQLHYKTITSTHCADIWHRLETVRARQQRN
jgi:hypothetical protein